MQAIAICLFPTSGPGTKPTSRYVLRHGRSYSGSGHALRFPLTHAVQAVTSRRLFEPV